MASKTISIHASPGAVVVSPESAIVDTGTSVKWSLHMAGRKSGHIIGLEIKFNGPSPFGPTQALYATNVSNVDGTAHVEVDAGPAQTPGDYKYDVSITDAAEPLFDIDPYLVVK